MSFNYKKQLLDGLSSLSNFTYSVSLRLDYNPEQEQKWVQINQDVEELIEKIENKYFSEK
ncbi:MAG: hypothetical protein WC055_00780 [Melioribacteraceae bacterium]